MTNQHLEALANQRAAYNGGKYELANQRAAYDERQFELTNQAAGRTDTGSDTQCPLCGKRFRHVWYVRRHMVIHTGEKRFSCHVCQRNFSLKQGLKQHLKLVHGALMD